MVEHITIAADQVDGNRIDLPQFAGMDLLVSLRGLSFFDDSEVSILPTGGFQLTDKTFVLGEKYTVIPISSIRPASSYAPGNVRQYPHTVKFYSLPDTSRDANGDWITGAVPTLVIKRGRAEVRSGNNNANAYITGADGVQVTFFCIVYLPLPVDRFAPGTMVEVLDGDHMLVRTHIKQFSKGQLNARIWL